MLSLLGTLYFLVGLACSTLCLLCVLLTFLGYLKKPRDSVEEENFYYQSEAEVKVPVYCISKEPIVDLSVVIPAYNEVARLPLMLEETVDFLKARVAKNTGFKYEIIVVDDGSKDKTADCALDFAKKANLKKGELVVVKLAINRGKGGAVAQGILRAKGKNILFADADGATRFSDVSILEEALAKLERKGLGLVVGSRSHLVNSEAVVKRSLLRNALMYGFHTYLYALGIRGIKDTQCGFKLFSRAAAHRIFSNLHAEGWIFDIETLLLARMFEIPISEVPVNWQEIEGSKVSIIRDAIKMALDLLMIRLSYFWGIWKIRLPISSSTFCSTSTTPVSSRKLRKHLQ
ncbi:dolichyl-phosphate beta-glucosyltransferase [Entomophthora muscae]|uniref:Dolichyl-phosphate beta-glucosyltransferase n=2 Tax=Entomophthora muscae TaxID=34485 RepID=A0ACC2RQV5_9FUNG|nr:dolichyl-phosphate beta-glucosyltransferase [Entomophthora muscae]